MRAHVDDLRAEVQDDALPDAIATDYRDASLSERQRAILDYAFKLTRTPADMNQADVDELLRRGLDDRAVHDLAQACAYFNYINRIADGLGVDLEAEMIPSAKTP